MLRIFGLSFAVTVLALAGAFWFGGWEVFAIVAILSILEISLSFDNAVVNATVLQRMSEWWQRLFLTVGILIAVFGMRLLFPIVVVVFTAQLGPLEVLDLAINDQDAYEAKMLEAKAAIASFGGMFLGMIFLDFMLEEREYRWVRWIEAPFARLGGVEAISIVIALAGLLATATWLDPANSSTIMVSGCLGLVTYLLVNGLASFFEISADPSTAETAGISGPASRAGGAVGLVGKAAFFSFLYLELLDASFSFDGVIGAFAITSNIFIIATGLGVGAMYVRSMTIYLVRKGTLREYVYLEHGAHYAIGVLAILLILTITFHIPEVVTGLIGLGFIFLAFLSSLAHRKREREKGHSVSSMSATE